MSNFLGSEHLPSSRGFSPSSQSRNGNSPVMSNSNQLNNNREDTPSRFAKCKATLHVEWTFRPKDSNFKIKEEKFRKVVLDKAVMILSDSAKKSQEYINRSQVVVTSVAISNTFNNSVYPVNISVPGVDKLVGRFDKNGHSYSATIYPGGHPSHHYNKIYKDKVSGTDEDLAKAAVLSEDTLNKNWHTVRDSNGGETLAMILPNTPLFNIFLKNSDKTNVDVNDTHLGGRLLSSAEKVKQVISHITTSRSKKFNFLDMETLSIGILRTDGLKFDDVTNTTLEGYKGKKNFEGVMEENCTIAFDITIEMMGATEVEAPKNSDATMGNSSNKENDKLPMSMGSGFQSKK